jgi:hypothetical protein
MLMLRAPLSPGGKSMALDYEALDYDSMVPENNLRLPDAVTVRHGPGPVLGRFVLAGDQQARKAGIHLRLRTDFEGLLELNRRQTALGNWYPLLGTFNPEGTDVSGRNGFWVAGENDAGEIITCSAGRAYHWVDTNLEEQVAEVFFGRDQGQPRSITVPAAKDIKGWVLKAGATWVHPDYRKRDLPQLMPRMARAYSLTRWPLDWTFAYIPKVLIDKGMAINYGSKHIGFSIFFPGSRFGEIGLSYTSAQEIYDDLGTFLAEELSDPASSKFAPLLPGTSLANEVTRVSPDSVRQGSSSRS